MATITIAVPDGNTCKGCEYKSHSSIEHAYGCYTEYDTCMIFKCRIEGLQKCIGCKLCAKTDEKGGV